MNLGEPEFKSIAKNIYFMRMEDNLDIIWGHFQSALWKLSSIAGLLADWNRINVCDRL